MKIYKERIFGPVLSVVHAKDYAVGLKLVNDHEYGNGVAIYTRDGDTARDFAAKCKIGMVGISVPIPVPLAYHTFGGWKRSGFGDLNQHGPDSIRFYTRTKTVTSRWPSSRKGRNSRSRRWDKAATGWQTLSGWTQILCSSPRAFQTPTPATTSPPRPGSAAPAARQC